jgi:radical SAM superfamily enzyme YgiQ (UPF0313 family)
MAFDVILIVGSRVMNNDYGHTLPIGAIYNKLLNKCDMKVCNVEDGSSKIPEAKFYGISAYYHEWDRTQKIIEKLKSKYPKSTVIVGGCFATAFPEMILECSFVDYVCLGEGAFTMEKLVLKNIPPESIPNIQSRTKKGILDIYEIADCSNIIRENIKGTWRNVWLPTMRGCPFKCSYCSASASEFMSRNFFYPINQIEKDVEFLSQNQENFQHVFFTSANGWLPSLDSFVRSVLDLFVKYKVYVPICFMIRPECCVHSKFRKLLSDYSSLRFGLYTGVENFDDKILADFNKGYTAQRVYSWLTEIAKYDNVDMLMVNLIVDTPKENAESIQINKYWVQKIYKDIFNKEEYLPKNYAFSSATSIIPLPGTKYFGYQKTNIYIGLQRLPDDENEKRKNIHFGLQRIINEENEKRKNLILSKGISSKMLLIQREKNLMI